MGYDMSREHNLLKNMENEVMMPDETKAAFYQSHAKDGYMVLCEDRERPVFDSFNFPARWSENPMHAFKGQGQPGEFYAFQVVVYADETDAGPIALRYEGFSLPVTCFNAGGTDMNGNAFTKTIIARKGRVQPLWFGVQIPEDFTAASVNGVITLAPEGKEPTDITIHIDVSGPVLEDGGDSEPWRHARLRWLNSTIAIDDEPTHPFTPLRVKNRTVRSLGHKVFLDENGLPTRTQSFFDKTVETVGLNPVEILRDGFAFTVAASGTSFTTSRTVKPLTFTETGRGVVRWTSESALGDALRLTCHATMEFDGYVAYDITITALRDTQVSDTRLTVPFTQTASQYWMGLGEMGGLRKQDLDWKWDETLNQDTMWMGAVNAGMMLRFKDEHYEKPPMLIYYHYHPLKMPKGWANDGNGGIQITDGGDGATLSAYSGAYDMKAGESRRFMFDISLTPLKPIDKAEHWNDHYFHHVPEDLKDVSRAGANIVNIHHANELNPYVNYPFFETDRVRAFTEACHANGLRAKLYYTVKELTVHQVEFWAFKSLGNELIPTAWEKGKSFQGLQADPDPWLEKADAWLDRYVGDEYMTAWRQRIQCENYPDEMEASVVAAPSSRFNNYFLEGVRWLLENTGMDGLYFDDVAFDRSIMKRVRKVLDRDHPRCAIDLHSWNYYKNNVCDDSRLAGWGNSMNLYIDNIAFIDRIWFGEGFDYDVAPDHWLIEISGIPFGVMGEMLQNGGNVWRGMTFGMSNRVPNPDNPSAMWDVWNDFRIVNAAMYGWWNENCPVTTDVDDIKATVYKHPHRVLISIGSWADGDREVHLNIDYAALGLRKETIRFTVPAIANFQETCALQPDQPVTIPAGKGLIIIVE